jgi:hypothetical protein
MAPRKPKLLTCPASGCGRPYKTQRGLDRHVEAKHVEPEPEVETPTAAVERALRSITITPKLAVLAATVRELAVALEACEPTDKAKTSKELTARMADLLGAGPSTPDDDDWTKGADE